jgi:hypothetical protein
MVWTQGPLIYDPGLSFFASESRVTGLSVVMENNKLSQALLGVPPRARVKEVY